ncbi:MAG: right-handed parallel beta-helix repeat-containing protein [Acidobacteria bacterium]|nr:right-handed parallel beta-helix repeat-containing protein [Acidobacteriota bacterium]
MIKTPLFALACIFIFPAYIADARTLEVGPDQKYTTPCQAFKDAGDGDTVHISAAGNYDGDVCRITANKLVIRGIYGRAKIDAAGQDAEGKAIWVIGGNDVTIENIELSGCSVPAKNGAGIRPEGTNLTVRNCYFHHNENGILCGKNSASEILIENTEFSDNGYGDGYSHNIYIGNIRKLTMKFCYSHHSNGGQLVKSRAVQNFILYNRLTDEGGSNYELDLPNGGISYVLGNIFQQSRTTTNSAILSFGVEGPAPANKLLVMNNTFVNDRYTGLFIQVDGRVKEPALIVNNIFSGKGIKCSQENALILANFLESDPQFRASSRFDYRLKVLSPCIDAGADLKKLGMEAFIPRYEYVHPCGSRPRIINHAVDIGAYEYAPGYR